jgi:hypothetical protein
VYSNLLNSFKFVGVSADEESVGLDISMHNESMNAPDPRKGKNPETK